MKYCPKCQRNYAVTQSVCQDDGDPLALKDLYGLTGRVINDKYKIESLVTIGGMSAVYRARQIGVERKVAFKILLPNLAVHDLNLLTLFEREARTAGRLTHENIATVHDAGRTEDDLAFIVMEWLEGRTLEEEFYEKGSLSYRRIVHLCRQIAAALDAAHAQNVIHRDLKPANIMILPRASRTTRLDREEERDLVKVFDFGLAKISSESTDLQVSSALGTPHYASPEQFRIGEEIDGRSDIYSFGVILYRMLTGRLPFDGHSVHELIRQHLLETPPPLRQLRPDASMELEHLVNRMLTKTPHYRPATATEAVEALEQALSTMDSGGELAAGFSSPVYGSGAYNTPVTPISLPVTSGSAVAGQSTTSPSLPGTANTNAGANSVLPGAASTGAAFATPPRNSTYVSFNANTAALGASGSNGNVTPTSLFPTDAATSSSLGSAIIPDTMPVPPTATTAQRSKWLAVLAAVVLLAGFALFYWLGSQRAPLAEKDTLLLGDVLNTTGEEFFGQSLKTALATQLTQSATLNLLPEEKMRAMLPYMNRPPDEPVTREIAREIAWRSKLKAAITAQIAKLDRHYSITVEAINSQSGETLARVMAEAPEKDQVLKALAQAAQKLRADLGNALPAIQFNAPIHEGTTASLEALKAYSLGYEQLYTRGDTAEALPYLQRASTLDANFALAHSTLSTLYLSNGLARQSTAAATEAYQLRARVSERERQIIEARYHLAVTGKLNEVLNRYQVLAQATPNAALIHTGLANLYQRNGQFAQALNEAETALKTAPRAVPAHWLRANNLIRLNRAPEAQAQIEQALAQKLDGGSLRYALFHVAHLQSNGDLLKQQLDWVRTQHQDELWLDWQAQVAAANGSLQTAAGHWRQAVDLARQHGPKEFAANLALNAALRLGIAGQPHEAQKFLAQSLSLARDNFGWYPLTTEAPFGPLVCALAGASDEARRTAEELQRNQPENTLAQKVWLPLTRALLALQNNAPGQALELLKNPALNESEAGLLPQWVRGQALLQLKRGPEAVAEFEQILAKRGQDSTWLLYPLGYLGKARALLLAGDPTQSRRYYKDFLELWRGADADLPIMTAAKQESLMAEAGGRK